MKREWTFTPSVNINDGKEFIAGDTLSATDLNVICNNSLYAASKASELNKKIDELEENIVTSNGTVIRDENGNIEVALTLHSDARDDERGVWSAKVSSRAIEELKDSLEEETFEYVSTDGNYLASFRRKGNFVTVACKQLKAESHTTNASLVPIEFHPKTNTYIPSFQGYVHGHFTIRTDGSIMFNSGVPSNADFTTSYIPDKLNKAKTTDDQELQKELELAELYRLKQDLLTEILNSQLGLTTANSLARDINKKAERYKELFLKYNENFIPNFNRKFLI